MEAILVWHASPPLRTLYRVLQKRIRLGETKLSIMSNPFCTSRKLYIKEKNEEINKNYSVIGDLKEKDSKGRSFSKYF